MRKNEIKKPILSEAQNNSINRCHPCNSSNSSRTQPVLMTGFQIKINSKTNLINNFKNLSNRISTNKTKILTICSGYSSQLAYRNNNNTISLISKTKIHSILDWHNQVSKNLQKTSLASNSNSSSIFSEIFSKKIRHKYNNSLSKNSSSSRHYLSQVE